MPPKTEPPKDGNPPLRFIAKPFSQLSLFELYEILRLRAEIFVVEQQCPFQDLDGLDPCCMHLMGISGDDLVAYARWYVEGQDRILGRIAVRPQGRGLGLGRLLVEAALKEIGPYPILIHAQAHLEAFYRTLGFQAQGELFDEDGILHRLMIRPAPA